MPPAGPAERFREARGPDEGMGWGSCGTRERGGWARLPNRAGVCHSRARTCRHMKDRAGHDSPRATSTRCVWRSKSRGSLVAGIEDVRALDERGRPRPVIGVRLADVTYRRAGLRARHGRRAATPATSRCDGASVAGPRLDRPAEAIDVRYRPRRGRWSHSPGQRAFLASERILPMLERCTRAQGYWLLVKRNLVRVGGTTCQRTRPVG